MLIREWDLLKITFPGATFLRRPSLVIEQRYTVSSKIQEIDFTLHKKMKFAIKDFISFCAVLLQTLPMTFPTFSL